MKKHILLFFSVLILISCNDSTNEVNTVDNENLEALDSLEMLHHTRIFTVSDEVLEGILNSIPSPLQFSDLLKDKNVDFNKTLLIKIKKSDDLVTNDEKAIAMGIYGTDLSYINIYKETVLSTQYYETLVKLSKELMLDQFFNVSTIELLKSNENNKENLLNIIRERYKEIHGYLKKQKRDDISIMMLYGSWIESFYISLNVHSSQKIDLSELIADQKITVNKFITVFNNLPGSEQKNNCSESLRKLQLVLNNIHIEYEHDSSFDVNDTTSVPELSYNAKKKIDVPAETITELLKLTNEVRNNLFN